MTYSASVYFFGQFRPAHFESDNLSRVADMARAAVAQTDKRDWITDRLSEGVKRLRRDGYSAFSCEHGPLGVSIAERAHDRFLDDLTADYPPYPGLDYSQAVNAPRGLDRDQAYHDKLTENFREFP